MAKVGNIKGKKDALDELFIELMKSMEVVHSPPKQDLFKSKSPIPTIETAEMCYGGFCRRMMEALSPYNIQYVLSL